jgi:hypothetical protein
MNPNQRIARLQDRIEQAELEWQQLKDQLGDTEKHLTHLLVATVLQTAIYGTLVYFWINR